MSKFDRNRLPKLTKEQARALRAPSTDQDIIWDTIEVSNTITDILLGAMIEPGRDREKWVRSQIRDRLAAKEMRRFRTYEILRSAQLEPSAFAWLRFYFNKFELTKCSNGGHLHAGRIVDVDYECKTYPGNC